VAFDWDDDIGIERLTSVLGNVKGIEGGDPLPPAQEGCRGKSMSFGFRLEVILVIVSTFRSLAATRL
jgi:hypothetical protein